MRLGGQIFQDWDTPEQWVSAVKAAGYRAAYCPVTLDADMDTIKAYASAAQKADIIIAEVGAWSNPLNPDDKSRTEAINYCKQSLHLADNIGARCCVNIAGSRGDKWDGPAADNLTDDTFEMIVETVREIIDAVKPQRTHYVLETMPWMYPDSADSYLRLIKAIDRVAFAVHFDPVNLINSPTKYFNNTELILDFFKKLGPYIKSCHAKDIVLGDSLILHLQEVCPGLGRLDYRTFLRELAKLDVDTPLMIEHLATEEAYLFASDFLYSLVKEEKLLAQGPQGGAARDSWG